jgi:hypothetical protein
VRLNLKELDTFTKCPMALCYPKKNETPLLTEQQRIFNSIITKAVLQIMETSHRVDWKRIIGWVDKETFLNVDVFNKEQYDVAKKNSEHILLSLGIWYEQLYLQWTAESFVNVPLGVEKSGVFLQANASVVSLMNPIVCTDITNKVFSTKKECFNDITVRAKAWLISEHLKCDKVSMQCISLGKRGGLEITRVDYDEKALKDIALHINNICRIIKQKLFYPSADCDYVNCGYHSK